MTLELQEPSTAPGRLEAEVDDVDPAALDALHRRIDALRAAYVGVTPPPLREDEKTALALRAARVGYWVLDLATGATEYSARARAQFGYEGDEPLAAGLVDLVHPADLEAFTSALEQKLHGLWPIDLECRLMTRHGSYRWYRLSADTRNSPEGTAEHLVGSLEDISVRKSLQEALALSNARLRQEIRDREHAEAELRHAQKLEAVGQLAAGVAHEINTPMQFIGDSLVFLRESFSDLTPLLRLYKELTAAAASTPALAALVDEIAEVESEIDLEFLLGEFGPAMDRTEEGVSRVTTIVRAMKRFARISDGEKQPADLNDAIASTLVVARNEYKYVADVETNLGELPPVLCQISDINQVLLNLIVNAAHAIQDVARPDGQRGKIYVRTDVTANGVFAEIGDTGCGVPREIVERIWDPFFTTKEVGRGTGQGLAIARSIIVDRHGGELSYRPRPGGGSVFTLTLPHSARAA